MSSNPEKKIIHGLTIWDKIFNEVHEISKKLEAMRSKLSRAEVKGGISDPERKITNRRGIKRIKGKLKVKLSWSFPSENI